jgi:parallel beta-helix repeat protein
MVDSPSAHDNTIYSNQVVDTTNVGIGISAGSNNVVRNNVLVSDGKLDDGTALAAANVGIYVWNMYHDPGWGTNEAYGNGVGWISAASVRNDWWLPDCSPKCSNIRLRRPINHAREAAMYRAWRAKLRRNGIRIGR